MATGDSNPSGAGRKIAPLIRRINVKPATAFLGSCGLTVLLLAGAVNSAIAQTSSYKAQMAQCREDEIKAEVTYANAKNACQGGNDVPTCINDATKDFNATM